MGRFASGKWRHAIRAANYLFSQVPAVLVWEGDRYFDDMFDMSWLNALLSIA